VSELTEEDLKRPIDYFGAGESTVLTVLKTHATHLVGSRYQVRYIRGAYSRAFGTNKAEFDRW